MLLKGLYSSLVPYELRKSCSHSNNDMSLLSKILLSHAD